jgi:uncharacterized protein (UPF0335 family)
MVSISEAELKRLLEKAEELETRRDKLFSDIEEKYVNRAASGVCQFIREKALMMKKRGMTDDPLYREIVEKFGDPEDPAFIERCARYMAPLYAVAFDKWDDNYFAGLIGKAGGVIRMLREL